MSRRDVKTIRYAIQDTFRDYIVDKFPIEEEQAKELSKEFAKDCLEELISRFSQDNLKGKGKK